MKATYLAVALVAVYLCAPPARADEYIILDQRADEFDRWDYPFEDPSGPVTIISRQTGLPVTVLNEQRTRTRLGYGGLLIANSLATETGRSFDEIVALKQSGHGWGWIAKENNVKVGPIVSRAKRADNDFREIRVKTNPGQTKAKVKGPKGNGGGGGKVKVKGNGGGGQGKVKVKGHAGGGQGKGHGGGKGKSK